MLGLLLTLTRDVFVEASMSSAAARRGHEAPKISPAVPPVRDDGLNDGAASATSRSKGLICISINAISFADNTQCKIFNVEILVS